MKPLGWAARCQWGSRLSLLGLVFLLPLFVLPGLNDAWDQSKILLTAALTFLALLLLSLARVRARSVTLRWSFPLVFFTCLSIWATISAVVNGSGYSAWIGLHGQYASSVLVLWLLTIFLWVWVQVMDGQWSARALRALTVSLTIGVLLSLVIVLAQIYSWSWLSELSNPLADDQLQLGLLLLLALVLLVHRWTSEMSAGRWWSFLFSLLATVLLILFDLTSVWGAMLVAMIMWLGIAWKRSTFVQKSFVMLLGLIAAAGLALPLQSWFFVNTYDPLPYVRLGRIVSVDQPLRSMVVGEGPQAAMVSFSRTMMTAQDEDAPAFAVFPEGQRVLSFSSHGLDLYFGIGIVGVLLFGVALLFGLRTQAKKSEETWRLDLLCKTQLVVLSLGMLLAPFSFLLFAFLALGLAMVPVSYEKTWQGGSSTMGRTVSIVFLVFLCSLGGAATVIGARMVRATMIATRARAEITTQARSLEELEQRFAAASRLDPVNPEYPLDQAENLIVQGQLHSRSGQQDLAESKFAAAIVLIDGVVQGPKDLVLLDRAYRLHETIARYSDQFSEASRSFLGLAQEREPSSPLWFERMGEWDLALFQLPRLSRPELIAEALSAYRQAHRLNPNRIEPLLGESKAKEAQGELAASVALLQEALRLHPDDQRLLIELGRLYRLTDKADAAIATFERVNQVYGDHAIALVHLEQLYETKGDVAQQKNLLSRLLIIEPENQQAKEKLDRLSPEE